MPTYHQNRNSTYSRPKYQTFKTYQVKVKLPEEPKTLEPVQQTLTEPKPENDTINNPQSKSQHKKSKIQLYSARERQRVRHEIVEQQFQTPATASTNDEEDTEYQIPEWEIEKGEKDSHQLEDDGRESVSNVSTAMTDSKHESCCSHTAEMIESGAEVLFDINLATEDGVMNVKIYNDSEEEDYQEILGQLCKVQKFDARMGLYFKINMYQLIKDRRGQGCKGVDDALGRLLEINYKLIMYESGLGRADQAIAPYVC